jgi:dTDP-4-amino-4,6-dideoxygalactose transaminase
MKNKPVPFVDVIRQHDSIQAELEAAVLAVMRRGDYIMGQAVQDFEQEFASACGVGHGVGVACGTDAIALGLQACGIGSGDEVILPANTFVATLIGVLRAGATPVLVDCEATTGLMDLAAAERAITPSTRAIIAVHLYGQMISPTMLINLASTYDLLIFEDAAQAHLAEREGYRAGSIGIGAAFSFYPSKNLGAMGDGGIFVTKDAGLAQKMRTLRNYGAPKKYFHTEVGTNSRLDTIQAAILQVKLPHLKSWNVQRNAIAVSYEQLLKPLIRKGISPLQNHTGSGHVYHLYLVRVVRNGEANFICGVDRDTLIERLEARGIQVGIHYPLPCHLQPGFQFLGYRAGDFPVAEKLAGEILSLPIFPGMTAEEIDRVVVALSDAIAQPADQAVDQTSDLLVSA